MSETEEKDKKKTRGPNKNPVTVRLPDTVVGSFKDQFRKDFQGYVAYVLQLYFLYLFQEKYKRTELPAVKSLQFETMRFCKLLVDTMIENQIPPNTVKTVPEMFAVIRKHSGLYDVKLWLDERNERKEKILTESGSKMKFAYLWDCSVTRKTEELFTGFHAFKNRITDVWDWMKVVDILICNETTASRMRLMTDNESVRKWSREKVFTQICMSLTLDKFTSTFSLDDVVSFIKVVGKSHDTWKASLEQRLVSLIGPEMKQIIFSQPLMQKFIKGLAKPENQTIFYFARTSGHPERFSVIREADQSVFIHLLRAFKNAVQFVGNKQFRRPSFQQAQAKINTFLFTRPIDEFHEVLIDEVHLSRWFSDEQWLRVVSCDVAKGRKLRESLDRVSNGKYRQIEVLVEKKFSLADILNNFWRQEKPFGQPFSLFHNDRSAIMVGKIKKIGRAGYVKTLVAIMSEQLPINEFREWLFYLEKEGHSIDFRSVNSYQAIALAFSAKKNPKMVAGWIDKFTFVKYLDNPHIQEMFDEQLKKYVRDQETLEELRKIKK